MESILKKLGNTQRNWLVTGAAGFIGSHLVETLLKLNQNVVALDNFSTGHRQNLNDVRSSVGDKIWNSLHFIEADIRDYEACLNACSQADIVLHQAALGSVPRSLQDPLTTNAVNVSGFLNMIYAAHKTNVKRFVFASSSSVYGDEPTLPKLETKIGKQLSPYAVTKRVNELYARNFSEIFQIETIGLRYFNVFGPRQDPGGPYAAVIPLWVTSLCKGEQGIIFGDGSTSRDFCYIENVVQANILAALTQEPKSINQVYNIAVGDTTSLNELYSILVEMISDQASLSLHDSPKFEEPRPGDIMHSNANIDRAIDLLGYQPEFKIRDGLKKTIEWYIKNPLVADS